MAPRPAAARRFCPPGEQKRAAIFRSANQLVEEHVEFGDLAIAYDNEIGARIGWRLARLARCPPHPPGGAVHLLGRGEFGVAKRRVRCPDLASVPIDCIVTAVDAVRGVEGAVLGPAARSCEWIDRFGAQLGARNGLDWGHS